MSDSNSDFDFMSYVDTFLGGVGSIADGVMDAFGGNTKPYMNDAFALFSGAPRDMGPNATPKTLSDAPPAGVVGGSDDGIFSKANSWLKNNKELANYGGGILLGLAQEQSKSDQAKSLAESRMAELRSKDALEQEAAARYSASVSGLKPTGLVGRQMGLKRLNGSSIYNNGKLAGG